MAYCLVLMACQEGQPSEQILFDFESDAELDRFHWKCHTLFSLIDEHVTHGEKSLRLELYLSDYPGLVPMIEENNWRGYRAFCFDIYNTEDKEFGISVRIDDREDYPDHEDRYLQSFILKPGMNRIRIPLDSMVTPGTRRNLDLRRIYRVFIFMGHPERRFVLYVDYIRLAS